MAARTVRNLIDGAWVESVTGRTLERRNPADTREVVSTFPESDAKDADAAVSAVAAGWQQWADTGPEQRAPRPRDRGRRARAAEATSLIDELVREEGKTRAEATMEVSRTPMNLRFYAGEAMRTAGRDPSQRRRRPRVHPARAGRRRRGDHALELPAQHPLPQARPGAGRRQRRGLQAQRGHPAARPAAGRRPARGRPAAERDRRPARRRGGRVRPGHRRARRRRHVHRFHECRRGDPPGLARQPAHAARDGRQEPARRAGGRRPRPGRDADRQGRLRALRPGLHRHQPRDRARRGARRPRRAHRGQGPGAAGRPRPRRRRGHGPAGHRAPAAVGPRLRGAGSRRRRPRSSPAARTTTRRT